MVDQRNGKNARLASVQDISAGTPLVAAAVPGLNSHKAKAELTRWRGFSVLVRSAGCRVARHIGLVRGPIDPVPNFPFHRGDGAVLQEIERRRLASKVDAVEISSLGTERVTSWRLEVLDTKTWSAEMTGRARAKNGQRLQRDSNHLAKAALDTLHGARGLPPAEAVAKLHHFLESIDTSVPDGPRFAVASEALRILASQLETDGTATDDDWQHAIETMLSLANEAAN